MEASIKENTVEKNFSNSMGLNKKRELDYINVMRFVATYLVIALHCLSPFLTRASLYGTKSWIFCDILNSIVRMGVPMFFMISGFLALNDKRTLNIREFYKKKIIKVLIPFLFWDIIYFLTNPIFQGGNISLSNFFAELLVRGSKYHLWFVYQIIAIYLITPYIKRIIDNLKEREKIGFLFVVLLVPTIFPFLNTIIPDFYISPFNMIIEGYVGYFIYGYILGTYRFTKKSINIIYTLGAVGFLLNVFGGYYFSSSNEINLIFNSGYALTHYLTAGAFFMFTKELCKNFSGKSIIGNLSKISKKLAKYSYGIYLSHVLIFEISTFVLVNLNFEFTPIGSMSFSFVFTSIISTVGIFIFSKIKGLKKVI